MVKIKEAFVIVLPSTGMPFSFEAGQTMDNPVIEKFLREQVPQFLEGTKPDPAIALAPKAKEDFKFMWGPSLVECRAGEPITNPDLARHLRAVLPELLEEPAAAPAKAGK